MACWGQTQSLNSPTAVALQSLEVQWVCWVRSSAAHQILPTRARSQLCLISRFRSCQTDPCRNRCQLLFSLLSFAATMLLLAANTKCSCYFNWWNEPLIEEKQFLCVCMPSSNECMSWKFLADPVKSYQEREGSRMHLCALIEWPLLNQVDFSG